MILSLYQYVIMFCNIKLKLLVLELIAV